MRGQNPEAGGQKPEYSLLNDTKIKFCNAFVALGLHCQKCKTCKTYISGGDGDLCDEGKQIIAVELAYAGTNLEFASLRGVKG